MNKLTSALIVVGMTAMLAGFSGCQKPQQNTKENLYKSMLALNNNKALVFTDFPKHLLPVQHLYQGTIFETQEGKLQLVYSFPNLCDEKNRYLTYFMRDDNGNYWTMVRETSDDNFHIYREDSEKAKDYFPDRQASLDNLAE